MTSSGASGPVRNSQDADLQWCASLLGELEVLSDKTRPFRSGRAGVRLLRTKIGDCYLKTYSDRLRWETEVHAYERWSGYFHGAAPRLIEVRDEEPFALVVRSIPGATLESKRASSDVEAPAWRQAGEALRMLHDADRGDFFGACYRDGKPQDGAVSDGETRVRDYLLERLDRGTQTGFLTESEVCTVEAALDLCSCFSEEPPIPCHGDYCPANWIVSPDYDLLGVIDFEMSHWDVRVSDLARWPDFEWAERPELSMAFIEAYGMEQDERQKQQLLIARTQYALTAVVWGSQNDYHGFARDGHNALAALSTRPA